MAPAVDDVEDLGDVVAPAVGEAVSLTLDDIVRLHDARQQMRAGAGGSGDEPALLRQGGVGLRRPVFDRFKGGRDGTLWYCQSLVDAVPDRISVKRALHDEVGRMSDFSGDTVATHAREQGNA